MKEASYKSVILPILLNFIILFVLYFLLPDLFPKYRAILLSISTLIVINLITSFIVRKKRLYHISKVVMNYYFVFILAILFTYYITTFLVFKEIYGLE